MLGGAEHHIHGGHFKGRFGGQLLSATGRDGNNNIFPVALAVVEQVCKESWIWFLKHFVDDIGKPEDLNLVFRDKPILSMLECIRVRLMTRLQTKRIEMEKYGGSMCPNVHDQLEKLKIESRFFSAMPSDRFKYEVDNDYERHVVDLTKKESTCRIWDLIDIPCKHGVSAIYKNREQPEDYLHNGYLKETYLEVYNDLRPLGRPKKLRRDPDKPRNPHKVSRLNRDIKCGKCKKVGHNSRSCNVGITSETSWHRSQGNTSSQPPSSQPPTTQQATRLQKRRSIIGGPDIAQWFSSTQPITHAPRETWDSRSSSSQPVSARGSTHVRRRRGVVASGAHSGAVVHTIGGTRKRGDGSSRPPKLPVVGEKCK
uniref:SWIM-type domain-containing protein n=1 Tax=Fagus sylvatica TaxID=28930 RepID=A0A2N9IXG7_FAGSY